MAEQTFNSQQALSILIQGVRIGQQKGAYTLEDAEVLAKAIKVFQPEKPAEAPATPEGNQTPSTPAEAQATAQTAAPVIEDAQVVQAPAETSNPVNPESPSTPEGTK